MANGKLNTKIKKYKSLAEYERDYIRNFQQQIDKLQGLINTSRELANLYDEQAKYLRGERTDDEKEKS